MIISNADSLQMIARKLLKDSFVNLAKSPIKLAKLLKVVKSYIKVENKPNDVRKKRMGEEEQLPLKRIPMTIQNDKTLR